MQVEQFRTDTLPMAQQFDAWLGWFGGVFDVIPHQAPAGGFAARSRIFTMDGGALGRVMAPAIRVTRDRRLVRSSPVDHWVVTMGLRSETAVSCGDARFVVPARRPFVVSLAQELVSERPQDERLHLYLARDGFPDLAPVLDAACGSAVQGALGDLLAEYLLLLEHHLPQLTAEDQARLRAAIGATLAATIAPSPDRVAQASAHLDLGRMERVRRAVREHLRSPELGPAMLCRLAGMSRTQLYRLLDGEGGVARYIQRQRLRECYALLCKPGREGSVAALAEELCFADASGFSRAFRREFGVSPTDVRAAARAGLAPAMPAGTAANDLRPPTLSECLRAR